MVTFTQREVRRLGDMLQATDPKSTDYLNILRAIDCLVGRQETLDEYLPSVDCSKADKAEEDKDYIIPDEAESEEDDSFLEEELPEEKPIEEADAKEYTLSEVRTALVAAKKKGFDSKALIESYGVANMTAIPAAKYGEIMAKLEGKY